ncbi:hypothetical protein P13BB106kb_p016 [Pectobacterium phage DU_PP_V]|uniref:Uncharacterized protein n=1 Tax=Pectobacterium phage DU_PP_V TaxID=2041492 RepID=A0A2D2W740_9CAUD|nr:hypothetical protein HOS40_gp016 [Pectobacterium phage DU_PP_V]ATS94000.1 hypothetical protein P13BB106kb_p016 [Pectobacterium phage DU_PP_V]
MIIVDISRIKVNGRYIVVELPHDAIDIRRTALTFAPQAEGMTATDWLSLFKEYAEVFNAKTIESTNLIRTLNSQGFVLLDVSFLGLEPMFPAGKMPLDIIAMGAEFNHVSDSLRFAVQNAQSLGVK